jgi:hypothetical protein
MISFVKRSEKIEGKEGYLVEKFKLETIAVAFATGLVLRPNIEI